MRVLLIEPYLGGSHAAWAEGYEASSRHEVTTITLPARWWKWRMRGGAVTVAERARGLAAAGYRPHAVLVSSMLDLALLRTLLASVWGTVPTALYLHETQLSYPTSPRSEPDLSYAFTNWTSALVADRVLFNSDFHLDVFFSGMRRLLRSFPDHTHEHLLDEVRARSSVLPVGVDLAWLPDSPPRRDPRLVLWNHRWEHDKDPTAFVDAAVRLARRGAEFRLALCGEVVGNASADRVRIVDELGERVVHAGHAPLAEYRSILTSAAVVVSTARQEFFGTSVVEAVAAGARPVLPDRLSYPWLVPDCFHDEVLYRDGELEAALARALEAGPAPPTLSQAMRRFGWDRMAPRYDAELDALVEVA